MKHEHKTGAWFELPDDITHKQLETWERTVQEITKDDQTTPATLTRASIAGALRAKIITASEGLPESEAAIGEASMKLTNWMAGEIGKFIVELKTTDPN